MAKTKIALARVYAPITRGERTEDGYRLTAYAFVNEEVASGPPISRAAMEAATPGYLQWSNVREMHGSSAAGVCERAEWNAVGCEMDLLIVDPTAIEKCERGVYKGLSVGVRPLVVRGGRVEKCEWIETSLVDRPADPDATFRVNRSNDAPEGEEVEAEDETPADESEEASEEARRGAFAETMAKIEPRTLTSRAIDVLSGQLYDALLYADGTAETRTTALDEALAEFRAYVSPLMQRGERFIELARSEEITSDTEPLAVRVQALEAKLAQLDKPADEGEEFLGRRASIVAGAPDASFNSVARTFGGGVAGQVQASATTEHVDALEAARKAAEAETDPVKRQEKVAEYSRLKQLSTQNAG